MSIALAEARIQSLLDFLRLNLWQWLDKFSFWDDNKKKKEKKTKRKTNDTRKEEDKEKASE